MTDANPPAGYHYEETPSTFINHVGPLFVKTVETADGEKQIWCAMRVEAHHVNAWKFAHGGFILTMAEIGTARASWDPNGPAIIAVDLNVQFIGAPKLGDWVEVCGAITKRTRTLVFTSARGEAGGQPVFFATSVQKIMAS